MSESAPAWDVEELLEHAGFLRALARRLVPDHHRADDIVQETWLAAAAHPPAKTGSPRSWLATVARNAARQMFRAEERRRRRESGERPETGLADPAEFTAREEARRLVVREVLGLAEPYRTVLVLRYFEGLAPRAIARRLEIPGSTVRVQHKRALDLLRKRFDQGHHGDRRAWVTALLPLLEMPRPGPGPSVWGTTLGVLLMSSKVKVMVAAAAVLLAVATTAFWLGNPGSPTRPEHDEPGRVGQPPDREPESATVAPALDGPRIRLNGRVVSTAGVPIPGALVGIYPRTRSLLAGYVLDESILLSEARNPPAALARTRAGPDGSFSLALTRGADAVVVASAKGFATGQTGGLDFAYDAERLLIRLAPGTTCAGVVLGEGGEPLEGASLTPILTRDPRFCLTTPGTAQVSGPDGAFRIQGLPIGVLTLLVEHPDHMSVILNDVPAPAADFRIVLSAGVPLEVLVTDREERRPVAWALVSATQSGAVALRGWTGEDGICRLERVRQDVALRIVATSERGGFGYREGVSARSKRVEVLLDPTRTLRGRAVTVEGEETRPVPGLTLLISDTGLFTRGVPRIVSTDDEGRFAVAGVVGDVLSIRAERGRPGFRIAPGAGARIRDWTEDDELQLVLERTARAAGRVLDPEGRPVPGARVSRTHATDENRFVIADEDGRFELRGVPDLRSRPGIRVEHPGFQIAEVPLVGDGQDGFQEVEIRLERGLTVRGRVLDESGAGLPGVLVSARPVGADPFDRVAVLPAHTGPDGSYRLAGLTVEPHQITARLAGYAPASLSNVTADPTGATAPDLVLMQGYTLSGRVVDQAGEPVGDASIHYGPGGSVHCDSQGRFEIAGLPAGYRSLDVRSTRGFQQEFLRLRIPVPEPIQIVLRRVGRVEGRVLGEEGSPVEGVDLKAIPSGWRDDAASNSYQGTDSGGAFQLGQIVQGEHVVLGGSGDLVIPPTVVREGDRDVEFRLEPACILTGRALGPDGKGVPGASVIAVAHHEAVPGGIWYPGRTIGADGRFEIRIPVGLRFTVHARASTLCGGPIHLTSPAGRHELKVSMHEGGTISGRLTRRDGGSLTIGIRAESADVYGVRWGVRADAEGRFRIEGLLPGKWWISCSTPDGATDLVKGVPTGTSDVRLEIGAK